MIWTSAFPDYKKKNSLLENVKLLEKIVHRLLKKEKK